MFPSVVVARSTLPDREADQTDSGATSAGGFLSCHSLEDNSELTVFPDNPYNDNNIHACIIIILNIYIAIIMLSVYYCYRYQTVGLSVCIIICCLHRSNSQHEITFNLL